MLRWLGTESGLPRSYRLRSKSTDDRRSTDSRIRVTGLWHTRKDVKGVPAAAYRNSDCRRTPSPSTVPRFGRCAPWSPARVPGECSSGASPSTVHSPAADAAIAAQARMQPRRSSQRQMRSGLRRLRRCDGRTDGLASVQRHCVGAVVPSLCPKEPHECHDDAKTPRPRADGLMQY